MFVMHWLWHSIKRFFSYPPIIGILLVWLLIVVINFHRNQFFTGWDNLHPELNIVENIYRAVSGVWQAHQGVGHTGGHGYSATILHSLTIGLLSIVLPQWSLRSVFTFGMLLIGSVGMVVMTRYLLRDKTKQLQQLAAWSAGLYYLLSIGTVQQFYIQLEAFIVHYAALPWLIVTFFQLLQERKRSTIVRFILVNILATPMGFIPPLFIVYSMIVTIISFGWIITHRSLESLKTIAIAGSIILCLNAFWLFPLAHYTITRSQEYLNSYNNQTSTPEFIEKNKKFGTFDHVAILRGLYFDSRDSIEQGVSFLIFEPWQQHLNKPAVKLWGYVTFLVITIGLFVSLYQRKTNNTSLHQRRILTIAALVCFTGLATNMPVFAQLSDVLREYLPVFKQAFRIAYTKLSISVLLFYALFFGIGISAFLNLIIHKFRSTRVLLLALVPLAWMIFSSFPIFQGSLLYRNAQQNIPQTYLNLIAFMKTQDRHERIANFAQGWRTGWVIYNWGYSGSGFLWYGIPQPILDRSFDVWSPYNENYYWQVSRALYRKDFNEIKRILEKYNVTWILLDPNARPYESVKEPLSYDFLKESLSNDPDFELTQSFTNNDDQEVVLPLLLYRYQQSHSLITTLTNPTSISPAYTFSDNDAAYEAYNNYVVKTESDIVYPFRTLFNNRTGQELSSRFQEQDDSISIQTSLQAKQGILSIKEAFQKEPYIAGKITFTQDALGSSLTLTYVPPSIELNSEFYSSQSAEIELAQGPAATSVDIFLNGDVRPIRLNTGESAFIQMTVAKENSFDISLNDLFINRTITPPSVSEFMNDIEINKEAELTLTIHFPKVEVLDSYVSGKDPLWSDINAHTCSPIEPRIEPYQMYTDRWIITPGAVPECVSIFSPQLPHASGYLITFTTSTIGSLPARFFVLNEETKRADVAMPITQSTTDKKYWLPLSPQLPYGLGYSFKFIVFPNILQKQLFQLRQFAYWPMPWYGITNMQFIANQPVKSFITSLPYTSVGTAYIKTKIINDNNNYISLLYGFDPGWKAYRVNSGLEELFPFIFGKELKNHVLVNNWANGWEIENGNENMEGGEKKIVIFFLPQLLQWLGYIIFFLPLIYSAKIGRDKVKSV